MPSDLFGTVPDSGPSLERQCRNNRAPEWEFSMPAWRRLTRATLDAAHTCDEKDLALAIHMCQRNALIFERSDNRLKAVPLACDRKMCPPCAREWSQRLQDVLMPIVARIDARRLRHLTLTVPSKPGQSLRFGLVGLRKCLRDWLHRGRDKRRSGYLRSIAGYCAKIEITRNERKALWHPHVHILLDVAAFFDFRASSEARKAWEGITEAEFGRAAVANWISRPRNAVGAACEIAKYVAKPVQCQAWSPRLLLDALLGAHRVRWLSSWGTIRARIARDKAGDMALVGFLRQIVEAVVSRWTDESEREEAWGVLRDVWPSIKSREMRDWVRERLASPKAEPMLKARRMWTPAFWADKDA